MGRSWRFSFRHRRTLSGVIEENDLRIDVRRWEGGGKGTWGLRLIHLPSGVSVEARGEYVEGYDPEPDLVKVKADLLRELETKLTDA